MAETLESDSINGPDSDLEMKSPIPHSASPDSSSSSSSDDEEDGHEDSKLEALERELVENPSNYDSHVQYIKALRRLGDIEKLRNAREAMNTIFPMSATMWQEWARDEASLQAGSEAFAAIESLYKRGLEEYLSVPLWCDYINFVQEHDESVSKCSPRGISKMRDIFERALTAAGLHISEGHNIWEAYREFEKAIFLTIDEDDKEEKTKQVLLIRGLFHRQLSVAHSELKATLNGYKIWEAEQGTTLEINSDNLDGIPSHVASAYQKALQMYNARVSFEEKISKSDLSESERLQHFMAYVKFEESCGDPARVQIVYERAVANFPVSSDLWISYTRYVDKTLKVPIVLKSVYSRATKNCTWIGELWSRYLLALERISAAEDEISMVFERSLQCIFSSIEEYLDLFLTRIDGLRRRLISAKEDVNNGISSAMIRETFQRAVDYLLPHLKNTESFLRLHAYWARLELALGKDLAAARGVWECFIKASGSVLEGWLSYIAMEIEADHINEARSIYKRCYSKRFPGTGSEDVCYSWLRFEREFGTLEDFDVAEKKVTPRLEELQLFKSRQESQTAAVPAVSHKVTQKSASQKRKPVDKSTDEQQPMKRKKDSHKKTEGFTEGKGRKDIEEKLEEANGVSSKDTSEDATSVQNLAGHEPVNEQSTGDNSGKEAKPSFYTDQCTAFISNIGLQANETHLREFFKDVGGVTAIRLLKDKFTGKSRGLAYVEFSDDEHLVAAVAKNRQKLLGQKLSIARSDPRHGQKRVSSGASAARGRGRTTSSSNNRDMGTDSNEPVTQSSVSHRRGGHVQLTGKNTFAMPRSVVRPLGWSNTDPPREVGGEEEQKPKSNDEFRKLLMKN